MSMLNSKMYDSVTFAFCMKTRERLFASEFNAGLYKPLLAVYSRCCDYCCD